MKSARMMALFVSLVLFSCGPSKESSQPGTDAVKEQPKPKPTYGKVQKVDIGPGIDQPMATHGKEVFDMKCTACHKYDERYVGPPLGTVTIRRTPEFVMNMILDTETMIDNDDTVKCLLQEYLLKMPNQSVDEKDARSVLEHLRAVAAKN